MEDLARLLSDPSTSEEALQLLRARCASHPADPKAFFDLAGAYDRLDREREAEDAYRAAERLGLDKLTPEDRARWHVQLGSTLRLLGRHDLSREVLERGEAEFPESRAIPAFLALTEVAAGRPARAARVLLRATLRSGDPEIEEYRRALSTYVDELAAET